LKNTELFDLSMLEPTTATVLPGTSAIMWWDISASLKIETLHLELLFVVSEIWLKCEKITMKREIFYGNILFFF